ncbi:hypothetical protein [Streptomyces hypolithicus]
MDSIGLAAALFDVGEPERAAAGRQALQSTSPATALQRWTSSARRVSELVARTPQTTRPRPDPPTRV